MSALFIETALKATALMAGVAIANIALRRRSAAAKHLTWTLALVGLLLLPIASLALPRWTIAIPLGAASPQQPERMADASQQEPRADPGPAIGKRAVSPPVVGTPRPAPNVSIATYVPWVAAVSAVYAVYVIGVLLLVMRLATERWTVHQLVRHAKEVKETSDPEWSRLLLDCARRLSLQRPVRLLRSVDSTMPMAFGLRRSTILVPSVADTWSEDRRRAVLLHELAHIARQDCATQLLAAVVCTAYWIHPGVWWIAQRLRADAELACDDRVLGAGTHADNYAEHLLELAYALGGTRAPALSASMARRRSIEGRLVAVLDRARDRAVPPRRSRVAALAVVSAFVVPLAAADTTVVPASVAAVAPARQVPAVSGPRTVAPPQLPGTWEIRPSERPRVVQLRLNERTDASHSSLLDIERLDGFSPAWLSGDGGPVQFRLRRDAGVLSFDGLFRSGLGAGTYTFTASATFAADLETRGFERPTPADQYLLARNDIGFAFIGELTAQGYARPALPSLLRAAEHGVDLNFLQEMGRLGYHLGTVETLIAQRDHGVSPQFIRDLRAQGLTGLSADDLVRARDHGIGAQYVSELRQLGYGPLSLDALVTARDHGISPAYVRDLRALGYSLNLDGLTRARDHGIGAEYIEELTALGYATLSFETLINARDHGISPTYVRDLQALGYRLSLDELTRARDHGVSAEYIRDMAAVGYEHLALDALIRLRDHGVTASYIRALTDRGEGHLTIDDLIARRDRGDGPNGAWRDSDRISNYLARLMAFIDRWLK